MMFFERPVSPTPDTRTAARSLAVGVLELCGLCEQLLDLAARNASPQSLEAIAEQLEAVRASATPLAAKTASAVTSSDAYSLSALGQWVWRE